MPYPHQIVLNRILTKTIKLQVLIQALTKDHSYKIIVAQDPSLIILLTEKITGNKKIKGYRII